MISKDLTKTINYKFIEKEEYFKNKDYYISLINDMYKGDKMLSTLYNEEINTINNHIKKYSYNELTENSTIRNF